MFRGDDETIHSSGSSFQAKIKTKQKKTQALLKHSLKILSRKRNGAGAVVVSLKNDWKADIFCSKTEDQQNNFLPLILEAEDDPIVQETSGNDPLGYAYRL